MTPETFLAEFGHFADAPNGVQKLRELILQLAVQGKLTGRGGLLAGGINTEDTESTEKSKRGLSSVSSVSSVVKILAGGSPPSFGCGVSAA